MFISPDDAAGAGWVHRHGVIVLGYLVAGAVLYLCVRPLYVRTFRQLTGLPMRPREEAWVLLVVALIGTLVWLTVTGDWDALGVALVILVGVGTASIGYLRIVIRRRGDESRAHVRGRLTELMCPALAEPDAPPPPSVAAHISALGELGFVPVTDGVLRVSDRTPVRWTVLARVVDGTWAEVGTADEWEGAMLELSTSARVSCDILVTTANVHVPAWVMWPLEFHQELPGAPVPALLARHEEGVRFLASHGYDPLALRGTPSVDDWMAVRAHHVTRLDWMPDQLILVECRGSQKPRPKAFLHPIERQLSTPRKLKDLRRVRARAVLSNSSEVPAVHRGP